jgi:hypothetical protein
MPCPGVTHFIAETIPIKQSGGSGGAHPMSNQQRLPDLATSVVRLPEGAGRADSTLHRLMVADKPFYVLRQRGRFADIIYDHGRLLAHEIEDGVFPEILSAIARGLELLPPAGDRRARRDRTR